MNSDVKKIIVKDSQIHGHGVFALVPIAEGDYLLMMGHGMLYNHSENANASWEIDDDNRFVRFYATKDVAAGEEILHDYGTEYWDTRKD